MKRLQWTLLLLATGLAISVALLASRALQGVAFEKAARHEAVASRVFDEMERALSRFLEREEARPFERYGQSGDESAQAGTEAFVIDYFQIEPDGSLRSPLQSSLEGAHRGAGLAGAPAEAQAAIDSLERVVRRNFLESDPLLGQKNAAKEQRPAPGSTKRLAAPAPSKDDAAREIAAEPKREDLVSAELSDDDARDANAYEVLQSFNQAAADRGERQQKVMIAKARKAPVAPAARPRAAPLASEAPTTRDAYRSPSRVAGAAAPGLDEAFAEQEFRDAPEAIEETLRVALDPMVGRAAGADLLLLYRTVVVGQQGYRQGLVIDRERLGQWLEERVGIAASGLAGSSEFWFFGSGQDVRYDAPPGWLAYEHRFAEPFDAFSVVLALAPLPGVASTTTIYGLIALVLGVATLGLFAVYRMAFVTLQYAERRSNFVSAVSHELKTPLTAIRMYGEMLRDGLATDEAKRRSYYETITDESERLSRLINNVLEFSKIERGGAEVSPTVGAIAPVLEEAVNTLRPHAERAGFALRMEVEDDLPALRFDRDCVVQLLFNLIDNALKYARSAEQKEIVVSCRREGDGVRLGVRDFGPGVSRQHLSKLFEPFYRGEDEMTRSARGTGIGLALVKDLAERMNAVARASNAPGGGFLVTVEFRPGG